MRTFNSIALSESSVQKLGDQVVQLLQPELVAGYEPQRYRTDWGTKTALGIGLCIVRLMEEAIDDEAVHTKKQFNEQSR